MGIGVTWYILTQFGHALNYVVSFAIFCILDLFDAFIFIIYKLLVYAIELECKPCYCFSDSNDTAASKIQLEDISDTLHSRRSFVSQFTRKTNAAFFTVVPPFLDMFQRWTKGKRLQPVCRWSDCDCMTCNSWSSSTARGSLIVRVESSEDVKAKEDVLFIHGITSSSSFWTETVFPNFRRETRMRYHLFVADLLGVRKSRKPLDSLYTLGEHIEMIEQSFVMYNVGSSHIVAHSLGSILAVALAASHPENVKMLTLVAPV